MFSTKYSQNMFTKIWYLKSKLGLWSGTVSCSREVVFSRLLSSSLPPLYISPTSCELCRPGRRNYLENPFWEKISLLTTSFENTKQGISKILKNRFPTISAAWVLAILRQDLNLSSHEQCITVWILGLVSPYTVAPGSILIGHPIKRECKLFIISCRSSSYLSRVVCNICLLQRILPWTWHCPPSIPSRTSLFPASAQRPSSSSPYSCPWPRASALYFHCWSWSWSCGKSSGS